MVVDDGEMGCRTLVAEVGVLCGVPSIMDVDGQRRCDVVQRVQGMSIPVCEGMVIFRFVKELETDDIWDIAEHLCEDFEDVPRACHIIRLVEESDGASLTTVRVIILLPWGSVQVCERRHTSAEHARKR